MIIGDNIEVMVLDISNESVKIGIICILLSGHIIVKLFNKYRHYSHKYVPLIGRDVYTRLNGTCNVRDYIFRNSARAASFTSCGTTGNVERMCWNSSSVKP